MSLVTLTPGLLDAEIAYRHERVAVDVTASRRARTWLDRVLRRRTTTPSDLTLAA